MRMPGKMALMCNVHQDQSLDMILRLFSSFLDLNLMTLIKRIRQWLKGIRENETKNSKRGAIKKKKMSQKVINFFQNLL